MRVTYNVFNQPGDGFAFAFSVDLDDPTADIVFEYGEDHPSSELNDYDTIITTRGAKYSPREAALQLDGWLHSSGFGAAIADPESFSVDVADPSLIEAEFVPDNL